MEWILLNPGPANTTPTVKPALVTPDLCHRLVPEEARSNILTTSRLLPALTYEALHDQLKRRGYVIYAGRGEIRKIAFRVANMGTLTPADMEGVVAAFEASLVELGSRGRAPR